jgi:isopentenyl-diphosphate Delta-isomerase
MITQDELLFVVDEQNNPLDPLPRSVVHQEKLWHRTSHIWVINNNKQILCHQRSLLKDISPGNWDPYFGGHLGPGVSYEDGAVIELEEETRIPTKKEKLVFYKIYRNKTVTEFQGVFAYIWEGNVQMLTFEEDEVAGVEWFPVKKVQELLKGKTPGWSKIAYAQGIFDWLDAHFISKK